MPYKSKKRSKDMCVYIVNTSTQLHTCRCNNTCRNIHLRTRTKQQKFDQLLDTYEKMPHFVFSDKTKSLKISLDIDKINSIISEWVRSYSLKAIGTRQFGINNE